jgi:hypothetical protein
MTACRHDDVDIMSDDTTDEPVQVVCLQCHEVWHVVKVKPVQVGLELLKPEPVKDDKMAEVTAERDRLQEEVDRLNGVVWEQTKLRAALAGARFARDEAQAERDRLRAVGRDLVGAAKAWANALALDAPLREQGRAVQAFADAVDAFDPMLSETTDALDVSGDMGGPDD